MVVKGEMFSIVVLSTVLYCSGAGKTTTFGMLTGEFPITSGTAIIDGFDVSTNLRDVSL